MIPELYKAEVIQTGISFMKVITEAYGSDEGLKLWDTIADTLDPDLKGEIFIAMITGEYNNSITLLGIEQDRMVPAIKEVRTWTGMGLKEAKDICDEVRGGKRVKITVKPIDRARALIGFAAAGVRV